MLTFFVQGSITDDSIYVLLMRTVYRLANSSAKSPVLSGHLMRTIFVGLADDTLCFLVGIWLHSYSDPASTVLTYVSLSHAAAFLEAHHATQHVIDFQTILPALLVAIQHSDRRVRDASLQCIAILSKLSGSKNPTSVYAYDAIYGTTSSMSSNLSL